MIEKLKVRKYFILAILLVGIITGMSFALTGPGVFTSVTVPDPIKIGYSNVLQYQISENSFITINIYDENGTPIRTLLNNVSKMAGIQNISWDTKDSNGILVPDGKYRFNFEAKDASGNLVGQAEQLTTAARQPSVSGLSDTPDPFNPLNNEQSAINYTISSDALVSITILKSATPIRTLLSNELKPAGSYTINWDGKDEQGNFAGDASYTYQVDAVSPLVPTFKGTAKSTLTLEKEPPQITGFNVTPNPLKIGVNSLSTTYTLSENAKVTIQILDSQGNLVQTLLNGVAKNAGNNSVSWNGRDSLGNLVPEGNYSAVISAVDNFNKPSGEQSLNFIAGYQPAISNVTAAPNPFNPVDVPLSINYTISKDALVTVTILKGTTPVRSLTAAELKPMGSYTVQWDGKDDAGNYAPDASYYYQIEAVSPTVAAFKNTSKLSVVLEKDVPQISGFSLTPDPMKLTTNSLSISYSLSENAKVYLKVLDASGNLIQTVAEGVSKNAGSNTASWNGKDSLGNYVPEGVYTVSISAADNYNNPSGEQQKTFTAGYLPALSGVSVINNPINPLSGEEAQINYTTSRDALVTIAIYKSSTLIKTLTNNELKLAGNYNTLWNGKDESDNLVGDGNYTYQIDVTSPTVPTFKSTAKGTITVEARDPSITEVSLSPTVVKLGYSSTIKYTLSEPATVEIKITDSQGTLIRNFPVVNKTNSGAYTQSWDSKNNAGQNVSSGDYILTITATDSYSKSTSAQLNFSAGEVPVIMNAYADPDTVDATNNVPAKIFYRVSERAFVTIKIYDANNRLYNTIASYKEVTGSDSVEWDGSDINGQKAAGTFTFKIDANSVIGNFKAQQVTGTVKVSVTPPVQGAKCTDCHKAYPTKHPVQNCYSCHSDSGPIENCMSCHAEMTGHADGSVMQNYSCSFCHNDTYSYKIENHPADNDAYHSKPFSMNACAQCHQTSITKEHSNVPLAEGQNECDVCHASPDPKVQKAVNDKNLNCSGCHTLHPVAGVNHTNPAYTGLPKEPDMTCSQCHVSDISDEHTTKKDANGNNYNCDTCHDSAKAEIKLAITNKDKNCEACHIDAATNEPQVHVSANSPMHDSNFVVNPDLACSQCHSSNNKVEHMEAKVRYTTDGQLFTCGTCHNSTNPAVIAAINSNNNQCTACHTYPTTKHQANHTAAIFTGDTARTDITTCSLCHTKSLNTEHLGKSTKTGAVMECNTCHGSSVAANVKTAVEAKNSNCDACHTTHAPKPAVTEHASLKAFVDQEDVNCTDCHQRNVKLEHMDMSGRTTVDGKAITCDTCHGSTNPTIKASITNKDDKCSACHMYPTTKHQPIHKTNIYTSDATRTDADTCIICHPSTNLETSHMGVKDTATNQNMTCNTCHASTNILVKDAIRTKQTNSCDACHLTHGPKSTKEVHETTDAFAANPDTDCATCHQRNVEIEHIEKGLTINGVAMTCDSCHSSTKPEVINAIKNKSSRCDACHNAQPIKHTPVHNASVLNSDTTRTDQTTCVICHTKSLTTEHMNKTTKTGATMDCKTCHSSTAADKVKTAIADKNGNCEACHTTHAPKPAVTEHASTNAYVTTEDVSCTNCHSRNNKTEHMDNSLRTTSTGDPITCDTCHGSNDAKVKAAITNEDDKCSACHTYPTTKHITIHKTNIYTSDATRTDANQCNICHNTTNLVDSHVGVVHSVTKQAMTCNTCHASTTPAVVSAIATKQTNSCEACHLVHAPKASSAVHDTADVFQASMNTECITCHDRNVETEHITKGKTINGVPMNCDSCHSSTDPKVVNAITNNNTRCDACHNAQPTKHTPVHNASVLTSDTTRNDQTTCVICHTKSLTTEHMNKTTKTGAIMDCKTCHSSTAADKVKTAIANKTGNCEACHTTHAPKPAVTEHASSNAYVDAEDVSCTNCHSRNNKTEHMDNSARTTSAGQPITCDTCHGSIDPKVQTAITNKEDKCSACHTYPTTKHIPIHKTNIYTSDVTRTDANQCNVCHSNTNLVDSHVGVVDTKTNQTMNCNTCHASTTPAVVTAIATGQTNSCEACHLVHAPKSSSEIHNSSDVFQATMDTNCASCHDRNIDTEHITRARLINGQPMTCESCHNSTKPEVINAINTNNTRCDACHASEPTKHNPVHNANSLNSDTTRTDQTTCTICHTKSLTNEHMNKQTTTGMTMDCNTCHSTTAAAKVKTAIETNTDNCEACHTTHPPKAAVSEHASTDVYVTNEDVSCNNCHQKNNKLEHMDNPARTTSTGQPIGCDTCHGSSNQAVQTAIANSDSKCSACHSYPTTKHVPIHKTNVLTNDLSRSDANTCNVCHSTTNLVDSHVGVMDTKTNQTMTCNTCHASTTPAVVNTIATGQTNSCEACHLVHAPKSTSTVHDTTDVFQATMDTDCASCHQRNVDLEHINNGITINGQPMTCESCHNSTKPEVINAINTNNTRCDACHAAQPTKHTPVHNTSVLTSDTARTDQTTCTICHTKSLTTEHMNKQTTAGVTMDCNTCHSSTAAAKVKTAIETNNDNCEACHTTHPPKAAVSEHASTDVYVTNEDVSCNNCHQKNNKLEHMDNPARTTSTGQPIGCDTCHGSSNQAVQTAIANSDNKCSACHSYPTTKHVPIHKTNVLTNDLTRSDANTCNVCHSTSNLVDSHVGVMDTKTNQTMTCNTCHASTIPAVINAISTGQTNSCEACHLVHAPKSTSTVHDTTDVFQATMDTDCASCHQRNVELEHIDNGITINGQPMTCESCHNSTKPEVINAINTNNTRCDACHAAQPTKHNPVHNASVLTSDTARTDLGTCSLCHSKSLTTEHLNKTTKTGATMDCKTCHSSTSSEKVKTAVANNIGNCEACHTIHAAKSAVTEHDSTGAFITNEDVNCAKCHSRNNKAEHMDKAGSTTSTGQPITCDTCHNSTNNTVKAAITNKDDKCSACHSYPTTKHQPVHSVNILTVDTTRTDDCTYCHVKALETEHIGKTHTGGGVMNCNTCHNSTDPQVITAMETKQTNSCEACHTLHPVKDINPIHDTINFTNQPYSEPDMSCSNCHNSVISSEHVGKATEAGTTMSCATCHKSTNSNVQTAITNGNTKCEACHTKVHTSANPYHATTFVTNKTMACEKCHNSNSTAEEHALYKTTGALGTTTGQSITCATCHNSTNSAVVNAIKTSNTKCDACHSTRHTDVQGPHKTTYLPGTGTCMTCHLKETITYGFTASYHKVSGVTPTANTLHGGIFVSPWTQTSDVECRGCHGPNPTNGNYYGKLLRGKYDNLTGQAGYAGSDQLCFICHLNTNYGAGYTGASNGTGFKTSTGRSLHTNGRHTNRGCQACHSVKLHSSSRLHFITFVGDPGEPYAKFTKFTHGTSYSKSSCTSSCH